jgi:hypothetical protein
MTDALFSINDDTSDQGYDASEGEVLELRLKTLPVSGVNSVVFQVFSPDAFDAELGIARNPPRASKDAPVLDLVGATTGQSVSPTSVDAAVTTTMPLSILCAASWIVRCVVNGGMGVLADGRTGVRSDLIHERMIAHRDGLGNRAIVASETTQYDDDGWAGAITEAWCNIANYVLPG